MRSLGLQLQGQGLPGLSGSLVLGTCLISALGHGVPGLSNRHLFAGQDQDAGSLSTQALRELPHPQQGTRQCPGAWVLWRRQDGAGRAGYKPGICLPASWLGVPTEELCEERSRVWPGRGRCALTESLQGAGKGRVGPFDGGPGT